MIFIAACVGIVYGMFYLISLLFTGNGKFGKVVLNIATFILFMVCGAQCDEFVLAFCAWVFIAIIMNLLFIDGEKANASDIQKRIESENEYTKHYRNFVREREEKNKKGTIEFTEKKR